MLSVFFFHDKKEPKNQEKNDCSARPTRHRVFSCPTRDFIMSILVDINMSLITLKHTQINHTEPTF